MLPLSTPPTAPTGPTELLDHLVGSGVFDNLAPPLQIALFLGVLGLLPTILVSITSFTRIIIVLSFVRRAMTTQEIPPNLSLIGLAIFMTVFTMGPTFSGVHDRALMPYLRQEITNVQAYQLAADEFHAFMLRQTRMTDLDLFLGMSRTNMQEHPSPEDTPMQVLIPAYMISELKTAFIMGFCIYVPFILVDLLVSTILMSLGMMMMPPVIVSAPIKLLLFVLADGWHLVARGLGASFL